MRKFVFVGLAMFGAFLGWYLFYNDRFVDSDQPIKIEHAYLRVTGGTVQSAAAFMVIVNHSGTNDRLVAVKTEIAELAEVHTHKEDSNGVMTMRPVENGLLIPSGQTTALDRGGNHIMMMALTETLQQGDGVKLVLTFEKAGLITVDALVDNAR
jgi:copper(I)-binding protein